MLFKFATIRLLNSLATMIQYFWLIWLIINRIVHAWLVRSLFHLRLYLSMLIYQSLWICWHWGANSIQSLSHLRGHFLDCGFLNTLWIDDTVFFLVAGFPVTRLLDYFSCVVERTLIWLLRVLGWTLLFRFLFRIDLLFIQSLRSWALLEILSIDSAWATFVFGRFLGFFLLHVFSGIHII